MRIAFTGDMLCYPSMTEAYTKDAILDYSPALSAIVTPYLESLKSTIEKAKSAAALSTSCTAAGNTILCPRHTPA